MPTLSNPTPVAGSGGTFWNNCAGCDDLFPADPDLGAEPDYCRRCCRGRPPARCAAAHDDDGSACEGPHDAVRVVDQVGEQLSGCVHHASVALASVEHASAYPGSVEGAEVEAYRRAQLREPFAFDPVAPWPAPDHIPGRGGR